MFDKDLVCNIYGVAVGSLPPALAAAFLVPADEKCVGILMRYEAGGSLHALLHTSQSTSLSPGATQSAANTPLTTMDRLEIISSIARGE